MSTFGNDLNVYGREDRFPVPDLPPGDTYVYDDDYIVILKDKAQAATNAISSVFEGEIHEAMCVTHAAIRWMSTNAGKFNHMPNKTKCINDINWHFKIAGHVNLVPVLLRLMMEKWVKEYGEPLVARDWLASWGEDILTRVQNCQLHLCPLRGGVPCDNNALEDPMHTFDVLSGWNKCFHIVRPIVPIDGDEGPIRYYVEWMSKVNQFPMISADEVIARKNKGLVACTCHEYLHYLFCKHSFGILKKRKIILGFPATMNPAPVNKRKRGAGRPKDIHPGEALNRDG